MTAFAASHASELACDGASASEKGSRVEKKRGNTRRTGRHKTDRANREAAKGYRPGRHIGERFVFHAGPTSPTSPRHPVPNTTEAKADRGKGGEEGGHSSLGQSSANGAKPNIGPLANNNGLMYMEAWFPYGGTNSALRMMASLTACTNMSVGTSGMCALACAHVLSSAPQNVVLEQSPRKRHGRRKTNDDNEFSPRACSKGNRDSFGSCSTT